ncbi:MAG: hypothetical protein MI920_20735 [Kiloniellales bacterium]|nr:hypothetical protein [Kiloniellales bacterium]
MASLTPGGLGRRALLSALLGLCGAGLARPGWAAKPGAFFEYTVFTKGRLPPEAYADRVIVALHGFLSVMPNSNFYQLSDAFGDDGITVAGFNYDYLDVAGNVTEFDAFHRDFLAGRQVIVVGTSLGGYWANYFANRIGADGLILVNPVPDGGAWAARNVKEHYSKKRDQTVVLTEETVEAYRALEAPNNAEVPRLLLVTEDDERLDHREAVSAFGDLRNTEVVAFHEGGHSLDLSRPEVMAVIRAFVERRFGP